MEQNDKKNKQTASKTLRKKKKRKENQNQYDRRVIPNTKPQRLLE